MPPEDVSSSIKYQDPRAVVLRRAKLILWDEAPMAPREALDCVDRLLRDLMSPDINPDIPFGGKVVVLVGNLSVKGCIKAPKPKKGRQLWGLRRR